MCPAELRHRIIIQKRIQTADGQGGFTESWSDVASVWSKIKPLSSNERYFSQKLEKTVTHKVTIRFRTEIDSSMRVKYGARIFKIQGIMDPDERRQWLELGCEEGTGS